MMTFFRILESMGRGKGQRMKASIFLDQGSDYYLLLYSLIFLRKNHKMNRTTACSGTKRKITLYEPPTVAKKGKARPSLLSSNKSHAQKYSQSI